MSNLLLYMCYKNEKEAEYYRQINFEKSRKRAGIPLDRPKRPYNKRQTIPIKFEDRKVIITFD